VSIHTNMYLVKQPSNFSSRNCTLPYQQGWARRCRIWRGSLKFRRFSNTHCNTSAIMHAITRLQNYSWASRKLLLAKSRIALRFCDIAPKQFYGVSTTCSMAYHDVAWPYFASNDDNMSHSDGNSISFLPCWPTLSSFSEYPSFQLLVLHPNKKKHTFVFSSTLHRDDGSFVCFVDKIAVPADQVYM